MIILGISDGSEPAAALLLNGNLVAAATEAAIRRAPATGFPSGAVDAVLDSAGVRPRDVDRVVFAGSFTPAALFRARPGLRRGGGSGEWTRGIQAFLRKSGLYMLDQSSVTGILQERLRRLGFEHAFIDTIEHDRAHATAAYRTQPRDELLLFTFDTPGDGAAFTLSRSRHLQIDRLHLQTSMSGLCCLLGRVAAILGVNEAALGEAATGADPALLEPLRAALRPLLRYEGPGFSRQPIRRGPDPLLRWKGQGAALAAAALEITGDALAACVQDHCRRLGVGDIAVNGALARLPGLTGRLLDLPEVRSLWVPPCPGDAGLAIGAALGAAGTGPLRLRDPCLGPEFDDKAAYRALSNASLPRDTHPDPEARAAELRADGQVVARCAGRLEFAAQGLGNRDFLAADPERLRAAIPGTTSCPTLPVLAVLADAAPALLPDLARAPDAARFATVAFRPDAAFSAAHPGFLRHDGRVLPQVVHVEDDPTFHALLCHFRARTGIPFLASAPLSRPGEPVANSPVDAIGVWRESRSETLIVGGYIVSR